MANETSSPTPATTPAQTTTPVVTVPGGTTPSKTPTAVAPPNLTPSNATSPAMLANHAPSTIQKQKLDVNTRPPYTPLMITIMEGAYANKVLDLGFNVVEWAESQNIEWSDTEGQGIQQGTTFKSIGPQTYSFKLEFWDNNEDIRQLVKNVKHIVELTDGMSRPPLLQLKIGHATIDNVVCDGSFSEHYDTPLPTGKGFRHGTVDISLKLVSGKGSATALNPVLSRTPLLDYKNKTTQTDRAKQAVNAKTTKLLAQCLNPAGSEALQSILDNNQLGNVNALLALPADTFIQMATAGISADILKNPQIQAKIKTDLATLMAKNEDGINPTQVSALATALKSGSPIGLPAQFNAPQAIQITNPDGTTTVQNKSLFELVNGDYQTIANAIQTQALNPDSPVFDPAVNPTAAARLNQTASCGLSLRAAGGLLIANPTASEAAVIAGINNALSNKNLSDADLKKLFSLPVNTPETVIRKLRKSGPYNSKSDFLQKASGYQQGLTGYTLWSGFDKVDSSTLSAINTFFKVDPKTNTGPTDDEIKKAFGINDDQLVIIKNGGKPFKNKQDFINKLSSQPGLEGKGNTIWLTFQQTQVLPKLSSNA